MNCCNEVFLKFKATASGIDVGAVALDGAGHSLMAEKPDDVLDNLIAFLA